MHSYIIKLYSYIIQKQYESYNLCITQYMLHTKLNFTTGDLILLTHAARMYQLYSLKMTL
jgi:hypothetical protein